MSTPTVATAPAPSPMPSNMTSAARAILFALAGYLAQSGRFDVGNPETVVSIGMAILGVVWIAVKNTRIAQSFAGWMQSPPVTLIEGSIVKGLPAPPPAAVALLLMIPFLGIVGCAGITPGGPIVPGSTAQVTVVSTDYGFDVAFGQAARAYKSWLLVASPDPATKAKVKGLFAALLTCPAGAVSTSSCTGLLAAADTAAKAADAATLTAQVAQVAAVIAQINAVVTPGAPVPTTAQLIAPAH